MASHWPCVIDFSGLSTYGLNDLQHGNENTRLNSSEDHGTTFFTIVGPAARLSKDESYSIAWC